mmetsp:Transcript_3174/g.3079  ORF Transcript_3174/g.3079 Transcript_3174/m.3079 type:complete len:91 (-) Transcript_3174:2450-2722(-)
MHYLFQVNYDPLQKVIGQIVDELSQHKEMIEKISGSQLPATNNYGMGVPEADDFYGHFPQKEGYNIEYGLEQAPYTQEDEDEQEEGVIDE